MNAEDNFFNILWNSEIQSVSFICCFNNAEQANKLRNDIVDKIPYAQTVFMDNTNSRYKSAAEAFNVGAILATGRVLIFLHQDILLNNVDDILYMLAFIVNHPKSIVGVAGSRIKGKYFIRKEFISAISDPHAPNGYNKCDGPALVDSLDECMFGMTRESFDILGGFDSANFDGWHMYGTDLCISAVLRGFDIYVLPVKINHLSGGNIDNQWYVYMNRARHKYKNRKKVICSSCGCMHVGWIGGCELFVYRVYCLIRGIINNIKVSILKINKIVSSKVIRNNV